MSIRPNAARVRCKAAMHDERQSFLPLRVASAADATACLTKESYSCRVPRGQRLLRGRRRVAGPHRYATSALFAEVSAGCVSRTARGIPSEAARGVAWPSDRARHPARLVCEARSLRTDRGEFASSAAISAPHDASVARRLLATRSPGLTGISPSLRRARARRQLPTRSRVRRGNAASSESRRVAGEDQEKPRLREAVPSSRPRWTAPQGALRMASWVPHIVSRCATRSASSPGA